jgi:hypothetical protein
MRTYALQLLGDVELARTLGERARNHIAKHHSPGRFSVQFRRAIAEAGKKHERKNRTTAGR